MTVPAPTDYYVLKEDIDPIELPDGGFLYPARSYAYSNALAPQLYDTLNYARNTGLVAFIVIASAP